MLLENANQIVLERKVVNSKTQNPPISLLGSQLANSKTQNPNPPISLLGSQLASSGIGSAISANASSAISANASSASAGNPSRSGGPDLTSGQSKNTLPSNYTTASYSINTNNNNYSNTNININSPEFEIGKVVQVTTERRPSAFGNNNLENNTANGAEIPALKPIYSHPVMPTFASPTSPPGSLKPGLRLRRQSSLLFTQSLSSQHATTGCDSSQSSLTSTSRVTNATQSPTTWSPSRINIKRKGTTLSPSDALSLPSKSITSSVQSPAASFMQSFNRAATFSVASLPSESGILVL